MRIALVGLALILSVGIFTACGGSSGATFGGPPTVVTPCPAGFTGSAPNCTATQANNSFTPLSTATTAPLPSIAGFSGTLLVPPAAIAAPITILDSPDPPSGISPLLRGKRSATAIGKTPQSGSGITALLYITLTASGQVTFTGFPGFTIALPSNLLNAGPFYLSQLINGVWTTVGGPVDQSGGTVTFSMIATGSLTIPSGGSAYFALYNGGTAPTPTPGATASPAPTTSASGAPTPTPSSSPTPGPSPSASTTPAPSPTVTATSPPTGAPSPTLAPTPTASATASATPFPTPSPTVTPSPPPAGATVASFTINGIPSGMFGSTTLGFINLKMLTANGAQITSTVSNTVTVTSSNSAVKLLVNSGTASTSVTMTSGSDLLRLSYSGLAINPVTLTISASGAATLTATFAPTALGVTYTGPLVSSNPEIDLYAPTGTGSTFSFTAGQLGWTGSYGQSLVTTIPAGCSSFASIATPAPAATNFTVNAIASPVPGTCTVGIAGFNNSINVTITYTTLGVTLH